MPLAASCRYRRWLYYDHAAPNLTFNKGVELNDIKPDRIANPIHHYHRRRHVRIVGLADC